MGTLTRRQAGGVDAVGGPQRGDPRQENSRLGRGCLPTHLDLAPALSNRVPPWRRADWTAGRWDGVCSLCRCYHSPPHEPHGHNDWGEAVVPLCHGSGTI